MGLENGFWAPGAPPGSFAGTLNVRRAGELCQRIRRRQMSFGGRASRWHKPRVPGPEGPSYSDTFASDAELSNGKIEKNWKANSGGVVQPRIPRMTRVGGKYFLHEETEKTERGLEKDGILTTERGPPAGADAERNAPCSRFAARSGGRGRPPPRPGRARSPVS